MRTRIYNGKEQIFCEWRHRWVRLTPEEWVRQQLLHRMVEQLGYPASLIAVEQAITVGEVRKRCDAVVYQPLTTHHSPLTIHHSPLTINHSPLTTNLSPLLLIECKAETVALTQKTLDQAIIYNRKLNVPNLLLCNGIQAIYVNGTNHYSQRIPRYSDLLRSEQQ